MGHVILSNGLWFDLDPQGKWPGLSNKEIFESLGLLPAFIDPQDERHPKEQFEANYGCGQLFEFQGCWIDEDGTYHSKYEEPSEVEPGDPPLPPIAFTQFHGVPIWFYQHGIVAIGDFITRMD